MAGYLIAGQKPKKIIVGNGSGVDAVKKRIVGTGSGAVVTWTSAPPAQGLLKNGNQQLVGTSTWEKVTGWKLDSAYPETDPAWTNDAILVPGRASFIATGSMSTTTTASQSRGVRIVNFNGGAILAENLASNAVANRDVSVVVGDATDAQLELHATSGGITSNRIIASDLTRISYRIGSFYEQLAAQAYTSGVTAEIPLTANALAEWPRVAGSGILLKAGTYQVVWNIFTNTTGLNWTVGCRVGANENQVSLGGTSTNIWNTTSQLVTLAADGYLMPTLKAISSSATINAGNLNFFITKA